MDLPTLFHGCVMHFWSLQSYHLLLKWICQNWPIWIQFLLSECSSRIPLKLVVILRKIGKADFILISNYHADVFSFAIVSFLYPYSTSFLIGKIVTIFFDLNLEMVGALFFAKSYDRITLVVQTTGEPRRLLIVDGLVFLKNEAVAYHIPIFELLLAYLLVNKLLIFSPYLYYVLSTIVVNKFFILDFELNWAIIICLIIANWSLDIVKLTNVYVEAHFF